MTEGPETWAFLFRYIFSFFYERSDYLIMCVFLIIFGFAMLWADRIYTDYRNDRNDKKTEQEEAKQENNKLVKK